MRSDQCCVGAQCGRAALGAHRTPPRVSVHGPACRSPCPPIAHCHLHLAIPGSRRRPAGQTWQQRRPFRRQRTLCAHCSVPCSECSSLPSRGQRQQRCGEAQAPGRRRLRLAAARRVWRQSRCHGGVRLAAAGDLSQGAGGPERRQGQGRHRHAQQGRGERCGDGPAARVCLLAAAAMHAATASLCSLCLLPRWFTASK